MQRELQKHINHLSFGRSSSLVMQHATELMMSQPAFKPAVTPFALPR